MSLAQATLHTEGELLTLRLDGSWHQGAVPSCPELPTESVKRLIIDGEHIEQWDSSLVAFARGTLYRAKDLGLDVEVLLPEGACRLAPSLE